MRLRARFAIYIQAGSWVRDWKHAEGGHRSGVCGANGARRLERQRNVGKPGAERNLQKMFTFVNSHKKLSDKHCVAVTKKSIALLDGFLIGVQDVLAAGECAY